MHGSNFWMQTDQTFKTKSILNVGPVLSTFMLCFKLYAAFVVKNASDALKQNYNHIARISIATETLLTQVLYPVVSSSYRGPFEAIFLLMVCHSIVSVLS